MDITALFSKYLMLLWSSEPCGWNLLGYLHNFRRSCLLLLSNQFSRAIPVKWISAIFLSSKTGRLMKYCYVRYSDHLCFPVWYIPVSKSLSYITCSSLWYITAISKMGKILPRKFNSKNACILYKFCMEQQRLKIPSITLVELNDKN